MNAMSTMPTDPARMTRMKKRCDAMTSVIAMGAPMMMMCMPATATK